MIRFSNGYEFDFGCASGALAFDGRGWWYDKPALWSGWLRPEELTVITKTLTMPAVAGNYRWWCPWRCVRPVSGGIWSCPDMVNAVALTNPSFPAWLRNIYPRISKRYKVMVSVMPNTVGEAEEMGAGLNDCDIVGVQLNAGCPNVARDHSVRHVCDLAHALGRKCRHPLTVKLAWQDDYIGILRGLRALQRHSSDPRHGTPVVEAAELINTVLFGTVFPGKKSPLSKYVPVAGRAPRCAGPGDPDDARLVGGASGPSIKPYAREALEKAVEADLGIPLISGGGNDSVAEVKFREGLGAKGWTFGTLFMWRPWEPNRIARECRKKASVDFFS